MTGLEVGTLMIFAVIALMIARAPIFLCMALVGAGGYVFQAGAPSLMSYLKGAMVSQFISYELAVLPMFLLMGAFAFRSGITKRLYDASSAWVGHYKGGVAQSTILGCAAFGSICGSSLATTTTMAQVALPEMRRLGYSGAVSSGTLAAGGTLGILIPPSSVLIIYAILTEQNIIKLFLAAVIPGLIAVAGYMTVVALITRNQTGQTGRIARVLWGERLRRLFDIWHVILVFVIVLGGIYGGIFTPTEGAAVGVVLTGIIAFYSGGMRLQGLTSAILETAATTAMIFAILFGADLFNIALALTRLPIDMAIWFGQADMTPYAILILILVGYLVMGCIMDSLSMILLTVPVIFPAFMALDFGMTQEHQALWFGILTLIVVELGMITPPVGLNLFIIAKLAGWIDRKEIYTGVIPFVGSELVRVIILLAAPGLCFWLVDVVF